MNDVDAFATQLLEEAKRFLEKAMDSSGDDKQPYLHAALLLGFASLEAHINSIADDFLVRDDITPLDRSILGEREIQLDGGEWTVSEKLKIFRLEDRIEFLYRRFSLRPLERESSEWSAIKSGLHIRNKITHPKGTELIRDIQVKQALEGVIGILDSLYQAVYKKPFPAARRGLHTQMSF
jgi:hypothetical protein